ncbi:ectoine/hydroxyectoine ABC transporter permease subunit EhuC [Pseudomonas fluorescens]|uniref:Ectoine/hydroxyectoine ABC transporter permease subunit EhuC n=1 Tax=Pseudomonas fluorescens TaxID=294 RepID=A0A327NCK0_PSEFL|nr:ectoine/hydroxyectoine ABC transporter permease subunit EhuC [Pseudomonas fluorescens]RAI72473.1 ectoine/hydroxyectoine ABC transporter permease subunit EhuC [Pseudomonas fluorescens]
MSNLETSVSYGWIILQGASATLQLTILSLITALVMAFIAGVSLTSENVFVRGLARTYVEVFRGTSAFVQLFVAFYVLPLVGIELSPIMAGVLALGLNGGSYAAEVVRSAIEAIGKDQRETTIALNLTKAQAMLWVILPQGIALMLPSFGNLAIEILKGTALVSLIAVPELTTQAQMVRSQTGETAYPFILLLITYLVIASLIMFLVRRLERHYRNRLSTAS